MTSSVGMSTFKGEIQIKEGAFMVATNGMLGVSADGDAENAKVFVATYRFDFRDKNTCDVNGHTLTVRSGSAGGLDVLSRQHIAGGANGLIAYAFHHYWRDAPADFDRCWRQVCEAYEEVRRLTPILLSDDETPVVSPSTDDVVCRAWHKDGFLYVLACNILDRPIEARACLSCGEWKMVGTELSCDGTMTDARTVSWRLPPLGVSIVRLERMQ